MYQEPCQVLVFSDKQNKQDHCSPGAYTLEENKWKKYKFINDNWYKEDIALKVYNKGDLIFSERSRKAFLIKYI